MTSTPLDGPDEPDEPVAVPDPADTRSGSLGGIDTGQEQESVAEQEPVVRRDPTGPPGSEAEAEAGTDDWPGDDRSGDHEPVAAAPADLAPPDSGPASQPTGEPTAGEEPTLGDELTVARRERDDYLDALRRLQADFENYKKRMAKQQADTTARAAESLVEKLLPALDVADLAVAHGSGEEVKQIWTALIEALEREGLERIDPAGGAFDPTRHDAVAHEPGDGGDQEVAEVLRAGYAWKGRVLRPAMVKVRG